MISRAQLKLIRSLGQKRHREEAGLFVAEGPKVIGELSRVCQPAELLHGADADRASFLQHPQGQLALFPIRPFASLASRSRLLLALDGVQDPGNLGATIRIADWFGIDRICCSEDTADAFSPKVVQASMGSLARVRVEYCDLERLVASLPEGFPVYGTFLDGEDIYGQSLSEEGLIVMGNEGNGISPTLRKHITRRLLVPSFPAGRPTAESLNVAVATALVCAEFRRKYGRTVYKT